MSGDLNGERLKEKQRKIRHGFPETTGLRVHRAISWIMRADACGDDHDARFVFLWIAFNAAYADESKFGVQPPAERSLFRDYFEKLVELDRNSRIYNALWQRFSGPVRMLMNSKYVFPPFWRFHNGMAGYENWEQRFESSKRRFQRDFRTNEVVKVLEQMFDRLYTLRNQIVHGGATWKSSVNRSQVRDGTEILGFLMPVFVDIMMDNPKRDWGEPFYPVVTEGAESAT